MAIENAACEDYITEKLWRPLSVGSVPLYWGSPSVQDWLPNSQSIIHIRDFSSPQHLAAHLHQLLSDDASYEKLLQHKLTSKVTNNILIDAITNRVWGVDNDPERINFIENFECSVCRAVHRQMNRATVKVIGKNHYNCDVPETVMDSLQENRDTDDKKKKPSSGWVEEWHRAKLEARFIKYLLKSGEYNPKTYHEDLLNYLVKEGHFRRFPPPYHDEL